jgi:hypothetical protein
MMLNATPSAKPAPTIAASGRSRAGAAITSEMAIAIAAVECPLGKASGDTWAPPMAPSKRG